MGKKSRRTKGGGNRKGLQAAAATTHGGRRGDPTQSVVISPALISGILSRGVPDHLNSPSLLEAFLAKFFRTAAPYQQLEPLLLAIYDGLLAGCPHSNQRVSLFGQEMPLIIWVCQWKLLNKNLGCSIFDDDLVELMLKAGADPNATLANKTNALFFAVKYGSSKSVQLLLEAGVDYQHRDKYGRTCLYNALEHPNPETLRLLLLDKKLPATELFGGDCWQDGRPYQTSLVDRILAPFISQPSPISWVVLGPPSVEQLEDALVFVRQKGACFTEEAGGFFLKILGTTLSGAVLVDDSTGNMVRNIEVFKQLGKTLVGMSIPEIFKQEEEEQLAEGTESLAVDDKTDEQEECYICLNPFNQKVTLYCGHSFCLLCIIAHGRRDNGVPHHVCPVCRSQLCPELSKIVHSKAAHLSLQQVLGLGRQTSAHQGPQHFNDKQVEFEAKAQGIYSRFSSNSNLRNKLLEAAENGFAASQAVSEMNFHKTENDAPVQGVGRTVLELSSATPLCQGTDQMIMNLCPSRGPVYIDISIAGVPILARISNFSIYTVFSQSAVDQLGLKRIETLKSKQFVSTVNAEKIKNATFTCLEPVEITLGDIGVTLHNAIEMAPDPEGVLFGVQLGLDFLNSGLGCIIDTEVGDGLMFRTVGESSWPIGTTPGKEESLRFYSHDGKMVEQPLIHFNPFGKGYFPGISLRENVTFEQCFWCCRTFPKGMLVCKECNLGAGHICTYCDKRCFRAAWEIHKATKEVHKRGQAVEKVD